MTEKVLDETPGGRVVLIEETADERQEREEEAFQRAVRVLHVTRGQARLLRRANR